jgi:hypothetical protein
MFIFIFLWNKKVHCKFLGTLMQALIQEDIANWVFLWGGYIYVSIKKKKEKKKIIWYLKKKKKAIHLNLCYFG